MTVAAIIPALIDTDQKLAWLDKCLESIYRQVDEVRLWDDGSPINIAPIASKYPNVIYGTDGHHGKSHARNMAVAHTSCKFVYPLDADDYVDSNAVGELFRNWNGKPIYSNLYKVHGDVVEQFELLSFDCEVELSKCLSPVNVLHTKAQWEEVGGWDENLNLYEDWEYNGRLFWTFCASRVQSYLVYYRQHESQSTVMSAGELEYLTRKHVTDMLDNYARRHIMACCGKKRVVGSANHTTPQIQSLSGTIQSQVQSIDVSIEANLVAMGDPGPGNVWAKYLGGRGMGPHNRRGMASRKVYQRISYGATVAARAEDVVSEDQFRAGKPNCGLVAMKNIPPPQPAPPTPSDPAPEQPVVNEVLRRKPARGVDREPVIKVSDINTSELAAKLVGMTASEIRTWAEESDLETVIKMLEAEGTSESPRTGVMKMLEKTKHRKADPGE